MGNVEKAILAVSFGTSYNKSRSKTIDVIEDDIRAAFPGYKVYRAWTSKMIIRHLLKRDGIKVPNVCEAMEQMMAEGVKQLIVQPTHIINGLENDLMKEDVLKYREHFEEIRFSTPLLTGTQDNEKVIEAVMKEYESLGSDEGLIWMGHGTAHYVNAVYAALDYTFKDMGYKNVFMGTVEAYPAINTILKFLKETSIRKVHLAPFMVVAGDHANNDMAGEEEDSWKSILEQEGYEVECHIKGLGEYPGVRNIYLEHLNEAMEG